MKPAVITCDNPRTTSTTIPATKDVANELFTRMWPRTQEVTQEKGIHNEEIAYIADVPSGTLHRLVHKEAHNLLGMYPPSSPSPSPPATSLLLPAPLLVFPDAVTATISTCKVRLQDAIEGFPAVSTIGCGTLHWRCKAK
jgi:hypothetical protein